MCPYILSQLFSFRESDTLRSDIVMYCFKVLVVFDLLSVLVVPTIHLYGGGGAFQVFVFVLYM